MNYESGIFSKKYLPSANPIPAPSPFQGERCLFQQAGRRSKKGKQSQIVIQNLAYFANGERDFIFEIKVLCFTKNMDSSSQKLGKADLILEELDLLAFLEQLGEAGVVGSVALNLIVK